MEKAFLPPYAFVHRVAIALCLLVPIAVKSQQPFDLKPSDGSPTEYKVDTKWPGIQYKVLRVQRIIENRLMVIVQVKAKADAPANGTEIDGGGSIPMPKHGKDDPTFIVKTPFLFDRCTMVEEKTQASYPSLPPVFPPHKIFLPSAVNGLLLPNRSFYVSIQFAVPPPPPPPPPGQPPTIQTLSFVLPNATGPITKVPLPPLGAPAPR